MSVYNLVLERRTIRKFHPEPVPEDLLDRLLDAGRLAPTGGNIQPLEFLAVSDPEVCRQVFPHTRWAGYLKDGAPKPGEEPTAYLVILRNTAITAYVPDQDIGFAAESIILTALDEGVASCAMGSLDRPALEQVLGIPKNREISLVIALGYPAETAVIEEMKDDDVKYWRDEQGIHHVPKRPKEKVCHWNRYGQKR